MEHFCLQNLVENLCFNSLSVTLSNQSTVHVCMKETYLKEVKLLGSLQ